MQVDKVITLKNQKKYLLLLESELEYEGYFLAVLLNENEEPTKNYAVLQEVKKDGKIFIKKIENPIVLNELLEDYQSQYEDLIEESKAA